MSLLERPSDSVLVRLKAGDGDALVEVFRRFSRRLIALARGRLQWRLRRKLDPEDVIQSVFRSFFTRYRQGQFDLTSWESLWTVLTVITVRKCINLNEHYLAARRDVRRELSLDDLHGEEWIFESLDRSPTSAEAILLTEILERFLRSIDDRDRKILELHLQGYTVAEISPRVGRAERTVRRTLDRLKKRLLMIDGPPGNGLLLPGEPKNQ